MHEEVTIALELDDEIFSPTPNPDDVLALEGSGYRIGRLRACQPPIEDGHVLEPPPRENGIEPGTDGLDLGKLGHAASLAPGRPASDRWSERLLRLDPPVVLGEPRFNRDHAGDVSEAGHPDTGAALPSAENLEDQWNGGVPSGPIW